MASVVSGNLPPHVFFTTSSALPFTRLEMQLKSISVIVTKLAMPKVKKFSNSQSQLFLVTNFYSCSFR